MGHCKREMWLSQGRAGYFSQMLPLVILEPPARCRLRCGFIASFLPHAPTTARGFRAGPTAIPSRGSRRANGRRSDCTLSKNAQLTHTARMKVSDVDIPYWICTSSRRDAAGFGDKALPPSPVNHPSSCATSFVFRSKARPSVVNIPGTYGQLESSRSRLKLPPPWAGNGAAQLSRRRHPTSEAGRHALGPEFTAA